MSEKIRARNTELEQSGGLAEADQTGASEKKWSYAHELLPWSGYFTRHNVFADFWRPYKLLASPIVIWTTLMWTNCLSWALAFAVTSSQIFSAPPYSFNVTQVGCINLAGFVASLLGTFISPWLSDWMSTNLARKNNGIYEPEFRLVILIPYLLLAVPGSVVFGVSIQNQEPWPVPVVLGLGMFILGTQLGATGVITYINDCYRDRAAEALAGPVAVKNIFTFALTFYINVSHLYPG